jgi:hypothetical protein
MAGHDAQALAAGSGAAGHGHHAVRPHAGFTDPVCAQGRGKARGLGAGAPSLRMDGEAVQKLAWLLNKHRIVTKLHGAGRRGSFSRAAFFHTIVWIEVYGRHGKKCWISRLKS